MNSSIRRILLSGILVSALLLASYAGIKYINAQDPLAVYKNVPGANITLPINVGQNTFSPSFVDEARKYFDSFHA